jgi:hypothetical protein
MEIQNINPNKGKFFLITNRFSGKKHWAYNKRLSSFRRYK